MPSALGPPAHGELDRAQTVEVEDPDELAVCIDETLRLKTRQRPADRFKRDAEKLPMSLRVKRRLNSLLA
jgi:hypothetical protein